VHPISKSHSPKLIPVSRVVVSFHQRKQQYCKVGRVGLFGLVFVFFSLFSISGIFYFILESLVYPLPIFKVKKKKVRVEKFGVYMGQGDVPCETL
jgi:hypothetical protein